MTKITSINIHPHQLLKFIVDKFTLGRVIPFFTVYNNGPQNIIIERPGSDQVFMREL